MNGFEQGFRPVVSFGLGGQESASKPPQAICKPLWCILNRRMNDKIGAYKSPGMVHGFDFIFEGEIRFGPTYYKLMLDRELVKNRIFGFEFKWHPESKYLALQEWLTTDYQKGPITALTLVDLKTRKFAKISKAEKGFIKPLKFENDLIIYEKEYFGTDKKGEFEIVLDKIENWENE